MTQSTQYTKEAFKSTSTHTHWNMSSRQSVYRFVIVVVAFLCKKRLLRYSLLYVISHKHTSECRRSTSELNIHLCLCLDSSALAFSLVIVGHMISHAKMNVRLCRGGVRPTFLRSMTHSNDWNFFPDQFQSFIHLHHATLTRNAFGINKFQWNRRRDSFRFYGQLLINFHASRSMNDVNKNTVDFPAHYAKHLAQFSHNDHIFSSSASLRHCDFFLFFSLVSYTCYLKDQKNFLNFFFFVYHKMKFNYQFNSQALSVSRDTTWFVNCGKKNCWIFLFVTKHEWSLFYFT